MAVGEGVGIAGRHGRAQARRRDEIGEDVAAGADDRQPGPDVVEHARAEREVGLEVLAMRADAEVGLDEIARPLV